MSIVYQAIEGYMEEILSNVQNGNKNKVIALINEMKNFYMTTQEMKVKKGSNKVNLDKPLEVIGKAIDVPNQNFDKPVRHIYY